MYHAETIGGSSAREREADVNAAAADAARLFPTIDRRPIAEWAAEYVDFGSGEAFKGNYDVRNVPWTAAILRDFQNPFVRKITAVMPPQESGKTKAAEVCLAWRICNEPGKMAFNTTTNVKATTWSQTRWRQMMVATPDIERRFSDDEDDKSRKRIVFKDGTFLLIQGAETPGNRQSDSIEVQINDECHLWEKPWMTQMHARLRAYKDTAKILNISLGGDKGSELEENFLEGTQGEWSHRCPKCTEFFQYVFNDQSPKCTIRFDLTKARLRSDDSLDLSEFEPTIRVICPHCAHEMRYDEQRLAEMNREGDYVYDRPIEGATVTSYHVNAFAIGRRPWVEILKPWVRLFLRGGVFARDILRQFITEELAEFWEDRPMVVSKEIRLGSYTRGEVLAPGAWKDEWIRAMGVDNQKGENGDRPHRWFVCRAFARDGRSRLIDCGRVDEWSTLQDRARALGVPEWTKERPGPWVVVDRRYDGIEVDEICARFKWTGTMGADVDEFVHSVHSEHAGKRMIFSEDRWTDVGFGTAEQGRLYAVYYLYASQKAEDALAMLRSGKADAFEVPSDIGQWCPEYAAHINSHRQRMIRDKKGNDVRMWEKIGGHADHLYDCEKQLVTVGLRAGAIRP